MTIATPENGTLVKEEVMILDHEAIKALPTGAALLESGCTQDDDIIYKMANETFTYYVEDIEDDEHAGFSNIVLPATLVNPEILGAFYSLPAADDIVEITHTPTGIGAHFAGVRASVISPEVGRDGKIWLQPLQARPDGWGTLSFLWPIEGLRIVQELEAVAFPDEEPLADWERELLEGDLEFDA